MTHTVTTVTMTLITLKHHDYDSDYDSHDYDSDYDSI